MGIVLKPLHGRLPVIGLPVEILVSNALALEPLAHDREQRRELRKDERFIAASLARRHQVDVNGRSLGPGLLTLTGALRGRAEPLALLLRLTPEDAVASVEAALPDDPVEARTERQYEQSGLYQVLSPLLGRRCPEMAAPLAVYRFFENAVKPRLATVREDVKGGFYGGHKAISRAADIPFCGARFSFRRSIEWRGSEDPHYSRTVKAYYVITLE